MRSKIRMNYHYVSFRRHKIKTVTTPNPGNDVKQLDLLFIAGKMYKTLWKIGSFFKKKKKKEEVYTYTNDSTQQSHSQLFIPEK